MADMRAALVEQPARLDRPDGGNLVSRDLVRALAVEGGCDSSSRHRTRKWPARWGRSGRKAIDVFKSFKTPVLRLFANMSHVVCSEYRLPGTWSCSA